MIYPEGGRSPDGWGQDFKGGAAYLSARTGVPVVPVFIDGSGAIFGKGMKRPKPGKTKVVFGAPLQPVEGESTRRFNARIEAAVTTLGDEALTDFWTPANARPRAPPEADRPGVQRMASPVGARRAPQARQGRACAAARSAAGRTWGESRACRTITLYSRLRLEATIVVPVAQPVLIQIGGEPRHGRRASSVKKKQRRLWQRAKGELQKARSMSQARTRSVNFW